MFSIQGTLFVKILTEGKKTIPISHLYVRMFILWLKKKEKKRKTYVDVN